MEALNLVSVPLIVAVVFGGVQLLKKAVNGNEKVLRFIPLMAAAFGAALGAAAFFTMPEVIPASNAFAALLTGGASGLAATGTHQIFKQLSPQDEEKAGGKEGEGEEDKTNDGTGK